MARAGKIAKTVLGSAAIAAIPTAALALPLPTPETENNDTFPGQEAIAGITYSGGLCNICPSPPDTIDFYHYTGLLPGGAFDLTFDPSPTESGVLTVGRYTSGGPPVDSVSSGDPIVHLTGLVPGNGELTFGVTMTGGMEGYLITLDAPKVAAPPALALLTAGLTALSLEVGRRRKRG